MINRLLYFKNRLGKWFWVIPVVAIFIIWRIIAGSGKTTKVQIVKVSDGNLVQSVSTSGTVKADQNSTLSFATGGKITGVWVKTGQSVKKGTAIAQVDAIPLNAAYQQALNNYRNYQANAEYVLDTVKNHSTDETLTQKATRTAAEVARDNAYDAVLAAQENLKNATLFAPFDGIVDTVNPSSAGVVVAPGLANYTIVNPDSVYFDAEVGETDLPNLELGQKVNLKLDAYPDTDFQGTVISIGIVAFTSSTGGNAYHIRISLPKNENLKFRVGMQGDCDIIFNTIQNVTKVSSSAVVGEGDKNYVWTISGGKAKKNEVTIGASSIDETEIKSGIDVGTEVIDNPPLNLVPGQKVAI